MKPRGGISGLSAINQGGGGGGGGNTTTTTGGSESISLTESNEAMFFSVDRFQISQIVDDGTSHVRCTCQTDHGLSDGDRIEIDGFDDGSYVRIVGTVTNTGDTDQFLLLDVDYTNDDYNGNWLYLTGHYVDQIVSDGGLPSHPQSTTLLPHALITGDIVNLYDTDYAAGDSSVTVISPTVFTSDEVGFGTDEFHRHWKYPDILTSSKSITPTVFTEETGSITVPPRSISWSNPSNIATSDGNAATAAFPGSGVTFTHYLVASGFGFSIPSNATVLGIVCEVQAKAPSITSFHTFLNVPSDSVYGENGNLAVPPSSSYTYVQFGSSVDLWGRSAGAITPADVNHTDFKIATWAGVATAQTLSVDHIRVTVYYSYPDPRN